MMSVSERRCDHGFMRSMVACKRCDTADHVARAKALALVDSPYLDRTPAPPIVVAEPLPEVAAFAFSVAAPGVPVWPLPNDAPPPAVVASGAFLSVHPDRVLEAAATAYCVSTRQILGKDRHQSIAAARLATYWLLRALCGLSYPQIGTLVGGRDHTTAMAGCKRVEQRRAKDERFRAHLDRIADALQEGG